MQANKQQNDKRSEFRFVKDCQNLTADMYMASADAKKELKYSICRKVTDLCCELVFSARLANSYNLGSKERADEQVRVKELLLQVKDLMPVMRRCRVISIGMEGEITRKIDNLKFSYGKWLESDAKRITESKNS